MREIFTGWVKLLSNLALWIGLFYVYLQTLTAAADFFAMPKGSVLTIIIFLTTWWFTAVSVQTLEKKYFGKEPKEPWFKVDIRKNVDVTAPTTFPYQRRYYQSYRDNIVDDDDSQF